MLAVIVCWVLAMVSGLCWAPLYTGILTMVTLLAFTWTQQAVLADWTTWLQLAAFGVTPWLLSAQRTREQGVLKRLHTQEAQEMARLGEAARSLLSLQQATQQMETQITEITDFYHITKEAARAMRLRELFEASLEIAPRILNVRGLRLIDLSESPSQVLRAVRMPDGQMRLALAEGGIAAADVSHPSEMEELVVQRALSQRRPGTVSAPELPGVSAEGISRMSWAPLWRDQQPVGMLLADELPEPQMKMLEILANQLSLQLARIHLYRQVEQLAVTDALTGLWVRRQFMERSREELGRCQRFGLACTLLMTDLDHFKQKNDTYGHLVGDVVLRDVARLLARNLREIDMIARYGGEEFMLLLIEIRCDQALPIAERLRQLVEIHPIRAYDELLAQTISIGLAGFPGHAKTLEELIERADRALYAAKEAGRNRVVTWSEALPVRYQPDPRE